MLPVCVVVQFYPWFRFYFLLFLGMVMCGNEFKTKENKIWTTDNIKPQHMYFGKRSTTVYIYLFIFNDITTRVYCGKLQFANLWVLGWKYVVACVASVSALFVFSFWFNFRAITRLETSASQARNSRATVQKPLAVRTDRTISFSM